MLRYKLSVLLIISAGHSVPNTLAPYGSRTPHNLMTAGSTTTASTTTFFRSRSCRSEGWTPPWLRSSSGVSAAHKTHPGLYLFFNTNLIKKTITLKSYQKYRVSVKVLGGRANATTWLCRNRMQSVDGAASSHGLVL